MKKLKYITLFFSVFFLSGKLCALPLQDDGKATSGARIFPKDMAMFCDISSHDANNSEKINECLNKILLLKHQRENYIKEYGPMFSDMYRQMSSEAMDLAVNNLAEDVEQQIENDVEETASTQGAKVDESAQIKKFQYKNALTAELAGKTIVNLMDVNGALMTLSGLKYFNSLETSDDAAEIDEPIE